MHWWLMTREEFNATTDSIARHWVLYVALIWVVGMLVVLFSGGRGGADQNSNRAAMDETMLGMADEMNRLSESMVRLADEMEKAP